MIKKILLLSIAFSTVLLLPAQELGKSASVLYNEAKQKQDAQDWYGAVESYQEAVQGNPHYGQAWFGLAECSYAMGEYELAISYAQTAETYIKNLSTAQNLQGFALIGLGKLNEARQIFTRVLAKYPNDMDACFGLAELDIFEGRITAAETNYRDALKRQPENRKALLSLALVSYELGKTQQAKTYIKQALRYHNESPAVHYFAAYLYAKDGDFQLAETHSRAAIVLDSEYDAAYELLACVLYENTRFQEVIDLCDYRLQRNRQISSAWFLKGLANTKLRRIDEALEAYTLGLSVSPEDEIMRAALEQLVFYNLDVEDSRRSEWSAWHLQKAVSYEQKYLLPQAKYEYRRSLIIEPNNNKARFAYADILLKEGYPERYVSQLQFLTSQGFKSNLVNDRLASFKTQLTASLSNTWKVDPFYLDRTRYKIGLYYLQGSVQLRHPEADSIAADLLAQVMTQDGLLEASSYGGPISGFSEAFNVSRKGAQDYFIITKLDENEREVTINCKMYVSRTGIEVANFTVYRTGNDRFINALRRMNQAVFVALPQRGVLINRNGSTGLIDLGKSDGVAAGTVYTILKKGTVITADKTIALNVNDANIIGTLTVTKVGEDISEGTIKISGFNDYINKGDEVIVVKPPETPTVPTVPIEQTTTATQKPALINMIHSIR